MAQVIFQGRGNARKNPFTQVVEGLNTAMAKRQAADLQSESNQALSDFASRIEGGGSSSQELVRLLKANPSAALALAQSKVPDILSAGEKQFKADAVDKKKASAFNKLMPAIKKSAEGIKSNPASGLFTSSGEIDPNFRLKERMSIDAVLNGMRSLTEDEFLAIKDEKFMQDILKNVANFTTGDVTKAEELLMSYTAGAAKDKRDFRNKLALETVKFQNDVQLTKEKALAEAKPQYKTVGGKLIRVTPEGDVQTVMEGKNIKTIKVRKFGEDGQALEQVFFYDADNPDTEFKPALDADGNPLLGPAGKQEVNVNIGEPAPSGERDKLANFLALENQLNDIADMFDPKFVGGLDNLIGAFRDTTGIGANQKEIMFRRTVNSLQDALIRAKSGAQINEAEFARLQKFIPTLGDSDAAFRGKMTGLQSELRNIIRVRQNSLKESGFIAPTGKDPGGVDLSQISDEELRSIANGGQ